MSAKTPDGRKWYDSVLYGPGGREFPHNRAIDDAMKDEILHRLGEVWKANPSLRLMQLLGNVLRGDPYYVEDYDAIRAVEDFYDRGADRGPDV